MDSQNKVLNDAITWVLKNEGGLVNDPADPGGITNFGISLPFLKSTGLRYDFLHQKVINSRSIAMLTRENAFEIYEKEFWNDSYFKIKSPKIAIYLMDCAVNHGTNKAHQLLQRATWSMTGREGGLDDDGFLGPLSMVIINELGPDLLIPFRSERAGYYRLLSETKAYSKKYLNGWLRRAYDEID